MAIEYDTTTIGSTIAQSRQGSLVLPQFQRGFDWSHAQQESLLASILAQLPIGGLLVLQGPRGSLASRPFITQHNVQPREDVTYLLDGQQRLTCTTSFFSDVFHPYDTWREHHRQIPSSLTYRWFLRIEPRRADAEDYFGIGELHFGRIPAEPETFTDLIHSEKVNRTERSPREWHPAWWAARPLTDNLKIQSARHDAAESFAAEGLVPLWELCSPGDGASLHEITLRLIAARRCEHLVSLGSEIPESVLIRLLHRRPDLAGTLNASIDDDKAAALRDMAADWRADVLKYLEQTVEQQVARIVLPVDEISRSVSIFETTNRGGTPLSTYDLVVARMARSTEYTDSLTELIRGFANACSCSIRAYASEANRIDDSFELAASDTDFVLIDEELTPRFKQAFLQVLSLKSCISDNGYGAISVQHTKKASILELTAQWITYHWESAARAVVAARSFLMARCGIRRSDDLRNQLILLPLAVLLDDNEIRDIPGALDKLEYWYWCSVLTGRYREQQNAQCIDDLKRLYDWLTGNVDNPLRNAEARVLDDPDYSNQIALLERGADSRVATDVGHYLPQYVLSRAPLDFLKPNLRLRACDVTSDLQLHHIVPLGSAATLQESAKLLRGDKDSVFNSPLNLTYVASETNQTLKSLPVATYMAEVDNAVRASHHLPVDSSAYKAVNSEGMEAVCRRVLEARHQALRAEIVNELTRLRGA